VRTRQIYRKLKLPILILVLGSAIGTCRAQERFFRVQDSIEMSTFVDPETRYGDGRDIDVKFSPDGRHFAVVTSRGIIRSNELESTLWVFDTEKVRKSLLSQEQGKSVEPRAVARFANGNNNAAISDIRWLADSKNISFVGESKGQGRRLYQAGAMGESVHPLTSKDVSVSRYEFLGGTGVYAVASTNEDLKQGLEGDAGNEDVRAVTGVPLDAVLFPNLYLDSPALKWHTLWKIRDGNNLPIIDPHSGKTVRVIIDDGYGNVLSLSKNGRSVIILRPLGRWDPEWNSYEPDTMHTKFHPEDSSEALLREWTKLPAEYALVDLTTGKSISLVNAPLAVLQGYGQPIKAVWSPDGREVAVTATYLPLTDVEAGERSRRNTPCAAAVVEIQSLHVTCARFMSHSTDPKGLFLRDLSFGKSDQELILHLVNADNKGEQTELYEEDGGLWKKVPFFSRRNSEMGGSIEPLSENDTETALSVFVHQGLNQSPALFARIAPGSVAKKIWDPNPQFAKMNLGEVSIERWKDPNGYAWVAGLVKPPDYVPGKKYPLVIQTHGFVEERFLTDGGYTTALAARPLAAAGIVVLQMPINREHIGTAEEVPDQIVGFESAIDRLDSEGLIDASRVGIIGFSRTCYHVEGELIKHPMRFAAATLADGVDESYMQYMLNSVGKNGQATEQEAIYGTRPFGEGLREWLIAAPGFNLDKVRTPVRIEAVSGAESILEEWEIYAALVLQNKPVDLIYFPHGVHMLEKPLERLASQQGNVDWFRFWLKGEEDTNPAKQKQYVRWRKLRAEAVSSMAPQSR
jgi:dipeptidyl aminopeptidase/acylaminoacyl peptidase